MRRSATSKEPAVSVIDNATRKPSEAGRRRILSRREEPLFIADWNRALFLHFEVDPERLQPHVPFELDLFENKRAFVSLVAFTMRGMRPRYGGAIGSWALRPIATHPFLNVRTYVHHRGEPGIHFLTEWLPNRLACLLGPPVFGLPYRFGDLDYRHDHEAGRIAGCVCDRGGRAMLEYDATIGRDLPANPCNSGSLDEFLIERYTAFTARKNRTGFFRVWHAPWLLAPLPINLRRNDLLEEAPGGTDWSTGAALSRAHYSTGAQNVRMGWPHRLKGPSRNEVAGKKAPILALVLKTLPTCFTSNTSLESASDGPFPMNE